ncbi:hypothetical protein [Exiguobacterium sp. ZOR0005]|uniref:hypothetical protein n=1 Tax=Exiguobacterium sp. ZOR0005 TaxID=1339226 RepID=UPI0006488299|nr:hypothetical protein [Exiguobacterium sp. ZOR0005]
MKKHRKWWSLLFVLMFVLSLLPMKGVVAEESSQQWCVSTTSDKTIYAGQHIPIGTVDFEFVANGLKIVIDLNDGVMLKDAAENVKIDFRLLSDSLERGSPGAYDFKTYSNVDPTHLVISYADLASYLGVDVSTLFSDGFQFNVFLHLDTVVNGADETAYPGDPGVGNPWVRYVTLTVEECTPPPPMDDYDVFTIGFWKNIFNFDKVTFSYGTVITIDGKDYSVIHDRAALALLMDPAKKGMTEEKRLIMQLTAAKINVLLNDADFQNLDLVYKDSGVEVGLTVGEMIAGADAALSSKNIDQMKYYQKLLDDFNNGLFIGTSHD